MTQHEFPLAQLPSVSPAPPPRSSTAATVLATLGVIAGLWWGQRFLIPLTAGLMLAVLVSPLTRRLAGWLHSAMAAAVVTLALVSGALAAGAFAFGGQLVRVAERLPEMISMAAQQMTPRDAGADSILKRAHDALQELDRAADRAIAARPSLRPGRRAAPAPALSAASAALPNNNITDGAGEALRGSALTGSGVLVGFAGNLGIIFFIAFFVLTGGPLLGERFLALWNYHPLAHQHARAVALECARQVRLYVGVILFTNFLVGGAVWAAFSLANLPDAAGWGVTAAIVHVVPYLGMALLTGLGAAEAFLVHETLAAAFAMAAFLVLLSTLIGSLGTTWLQGRAARMNPAAVFIGLVFWGALWGIWGLFLGPALVVMFKVLAEHSGPGLRLARLMRG